MSRIYEVAESLVEAGFVNARENLKPTGYSNVCTRKNLFVELEADMMGEAGEGPTAKGSRTMQTQRALRGDGCPGSHLW